MGNQKENENQEGLRSQNLGLEPVPPPPKKNLQIIQIDRIWLPDPVKHSDKFPELQDLQNLLIARRFKQQRSVYWDLSKNTQDNGKKFKDTFLNCAEKFDYSTYLTKEYYDDIPMRALLKANR